MKLNGLLIFLALVFLFVPATATSATTLRGVGVDALDGESINVRVHNRLVTVRLCAVTAPKKGQTLADVVRDHLAQLTKEKQVSIDYNSVSRDGMIVGIVTVDGRDIGMQMIRDGAALYNRQYEIDVPAQSRALYEQSEQAARAEGRGVWQGRPDLSIEKLESEHPVSSSQTEADRMEAKRLSTEARELILQGDNKAAMPRLREAIRLDPNLGDAHKNLALLFCNTERFEDALPEAREAVRLSPDFDKAHNVMGKTLYGLGDFEGSIKSYKQAIALNPGYGIAYYNLGVAYQRLKQFQPALAAYQQAERLVEETPTSAETQLNIGVVLDQLGRRAEARHRWQKVLTMGDPAAAALAEQNLSQQSKK